MLLFQGLIVVYLVAVVLLVRRQIYQVKDYAIWCSILVFLWSYKNILTYSCDPPIHFPAFSTWITGFRRWGRIWRSGCDDWRRGAHKACQHSRPSSPHLSYSFFRISLYFYTSYVFIFLWLTKKGAQGMLAFPTPFPHIS